MGTLCFSLSLLAHWDAVFVLVPIIYFYGSFLLRKDTDRKLKRQVTLANLSLGALILLPFLVPYALNQQTNTENLTYFDRRIGTSEYSLKQHAFIFELYNPFITLYFLVILTPLCLLKIKRSWPFIVWFLLNFLAIKLFMEKPGTHIYNYVIPLIFLASLGIASLYRHKKLFYTLFFVPIAVVGAYLYIQSYTLFVDHSAEYPWESKEILKTKDGKFVTNIYEEKEVLMFGFPHFRNWKHVNEIVINDTDGCPYISNEGKEIAQFYMDAKWGISENKDCYYIANVKRPFINGGKNAAFAKTSRKDPTYVYKRGEEWLLKLYRIETK